MDEIRKALSSMDSIETPDLWPETERRVAASECARQRATGRLQTMFSATKFVVAGAIVALFGGFLLAGLLAQRSDEPLPPAAATTSASP